MSFWKNCILVYTAPAKRIILSQRWLFEVRLEVQYHMTIFCSPIVSQVCYKLWKSHCLNHTKHLFFLPAKQITQVASLIVCFFLKEGKIGIFSYHCWYLPCIKMLLGFVQIRFTGFIALLWIDMLPISDNNRCSAFSLYRK